MYSHHTLEIAQNYTVGWKIKNIGTSCEIEAWPYLKYAYYSVTREELKKKKKKQEIDTSKNFQILMLQNLSKERNFL